MAVCALTIFRWREIDRRGFRLTAMGSTVNCAVAAPDRAV